MTITNTNKVNLKNLKQKESEFWGIVKQKDCSRGQKKACLKQIAIIQNKIKSLK